MMPPMGLSASLPTKSVKSEKWGTTDPEPQLVWSTVMETDLSIFGRDLFHLSLLLIQNKVQVQFQNQTLVSDLYCNLTLVKFLH